MSSENKFDNATAYELYIGRWSRKVAQIFIDWLAVPSGSAWLDVGAGTGILSDVILRQTSPAKVVGLDTSAAFIQLAREQVTDARAEFRVGDATQLQLGDEKFDVAVAGLVLNFISSPQTAVSNMAGLVKAGGMVAAYVWDYADKMEMIRHFWGAAINVDPAAAELDSGKMFPICRPGPLTELFEGAGLKDVNVRQIDIQTVFSDFDDFWLPFLEAQGSVSRYLRGQKPETLAAIRDQLQHQLPIEADGSIKLMARAWAVKGLK